MKKTSVLNRIEKEIEILPSEDLIKLLDGIVHRLQKTMKPKTSYKWEKLYGAGRGLWKEDAQDYVDKLREDR